jgi:hypothetical protein
MKTHLLCLVLALLVSDDKVKDEAVIPYENYYIQVETNDWLNRARRPDRLRLHGIHVSVSLSGNVEHVLKDARAVVTARCIGLRDPRIDGALSAADLDALFEASASAQQNKAFRKELKSKSRFDQDVLTVIETVKDHDYSIIRIKRGTSEVFVDEMEGKRVQEALREAKIGEAWFNKLISSKEIRPTLTTGDKRMKVKWSNRPRLRTLPKKDPRFDQPGIASNAITTRFQ